MLRSVSALAFLLIFLPAFGQESKTVFVDEADCGLKEVGYKGKPNAFTVAGKSDQMGRSPSAKYPFLERSMNSNSATVF